jgi:hypothetical protein
MEGEIVKNKSNWLQWFIILSVIGLTFKGIEFVYYSVSMDYCDCSEYSSDALIYSAMGSDYGSFNESAIEFCADKIIDKMDFDMDSGKLSIDYMKQFSYEMCEYGYYETKGSDGGKKIYE